MRGVLRVVILLSAAAMTFNLLADEVIVPGIIGTCLPVSAGQGCGVSFQIFPGPGHTKPANEVLEFFTVNIDLMNDSNFASADYSFALNQMGGIPLFYALDGTLSAGQTSMLSGGPYHNGNAGVIPPTHLSTSPVDFTLQNWNNPQNGVIPGIVYNDSAGGGPDITLLSASITLDFELVPEPGTVGLTGAGLLLLLGALRKHRLG